jgi:hypothetical protein
MHVNIQKKVYKTTHILAERHLQLEAEILNYKQKTGEDLTLRELMDRKLAVPFKFTK